MSKNNLDIIQNLSFLYELSLSIGYDTDIDKSCIHFLETLMFRKSLASASFWYKKEHLNCYSLLCGMPRRNFKLKETVFSPTFFRLFDEEKVIISDEKFISNLIAYNECFEGESFLILQLSGPSFLILSRVDFPFTKLEIFQMEKVINRFGVYIESLFLNQKLEAEVKARKETEYELKKYIDSNLQLENFAYIASHDLKAPIRTIESFSKLLYDKVKHDISEKELKFLDIIKDSSSDMLHLIDDLLMYSKVNSEDLHLEEINVRSLLNHIFNELHIVDNIDIDVFNCHDLPEYIYADKIKIRQLFSNLLGNAIKFKQQDRLVSIDIFSTQDNDYWNFEIRDNGMGIEADYLDKIFQMFQKLHSSKKWSGTGMGLAICKKIIERHNGKIEVESEINVGSNFYFSISKRLKKSDSAYHSKINSDFADQQL